jgi:branched-subunit amino acid ABC-type transport system permease component
MAGSLAALGGVLLAASTSLHPYILSLQVLPAFVAALLGGLENVPGALVGSAVVGLTVGIVPVLGPVGESVGASQLALAVVAFAIMSLRGARFSTTQSSADAGGLL